MSEQGNNSAVMREALLRIENATTDCLIFDHKTRALNDLVTSALSAPPRNCDVGSPDEQEERFLAECKRYDHCTPCPVHAEWGEFREGKPKSCRFIWAQMPYRNKEE